MHATRQKQNCMRFFRHDFLESLPQTVWLGFETGHPSLTSDANKKLVTGYFW
jgi:hypothetical protein